MPAPGACLTFQANKQLARHDWLHLTPAYAADLVSDILSETDRSAVIFDPFLGSGTTIIRAAEMGFRSTGWDINPFLLEVVRSKSLQLDAETCSEIYEQGLALVDSATLLTEYCAEPDMHNIDRWWSTEHRRQLCQLKSLILKLPHSQPASQLMRMAFAHALKTSAQVHHRHHSLSFSDEKNTSQVSSEFLQALHSYLQDTLHTFTHAPLIERHDARLPDNNLDADILLCSPPYPNRMSYMREMRPYLYWLDYVDAAHQVADLDWLAIGGSWGTATNRLKTWRPDQFDHAVPALIKCLAQLPKRSSTALIQQYLIRYAQDMHAHFSAMHHSLRSGTEVHYIIGNARYYNVNFDSDALFRELLQQCGFVDINSRILRRRSSHKQLFEYCVSARVA